MPDVEIKAQRQREEIVRLGHRGSRRVTRSHAVA
jgi:hypothetical protein